MAPNARHTNLPPIPCDPGVLARVAAEEGMDRTKLAEAINQGTVVILQNAARRNPHPLAVGANCRVKVNANLGTSPAHYDLEVELEKLRQAEEAGADSVMDLSTGGDLDRIRREIIDASRVPVGTVPIYQAAVETVREGKTIPHMDPERLFETIERHAEDGVDFVTVHCGVTQRAVERLRQQGRVTHIVSRGGAFLYEWMLVNSRENPLYEHFDRLLTIARRYRLTLSLGDGLRPGSLADATDRAQLEELATLGELAAEAHRQGVQVMIEGPGHIPMHEIEANVLLEKKLCQGAPFYVLGPLVTDIAAGYDHIVSAIGGALAAWYGADFLCAVSPSEHLGLPRADEVREGVIAARIAAHAAEIARGRQRAIERDHAMSVCRFKLDWKGQAHYALDPARFAERLETPARDSRIIPEDTACSMCGDFCAMKVARQTTG